MKKVNLASAGVLALIVACASAYGATVYEDDFDGDGLGVNAGTGGGLNMAGVANSATWYDGGDLTFSPDNGDANERAVISSIHSFSLSGGFELTVMYWVQDITSDTAGNRFSFGLINADVSGLNTDPFALTNGTRPDDFSGVGLNITAEDSLQGLTLTEGVSGAYSVTHVAGQSAFISSITGLNTMTLTVDAAGNYDLELNGSSVGSGASGLDLSSAFYFAAFSQDNLANPSISSVSLTTVEGENLAPIANAQSVDTFTDTSVEITLTGFDYDGSNLTYSVETFPTNGTLEGATNVWIYTPTNGYLGADSFTFMVYNGETNSAPATVSITVSEDELYEGPEYTDAYTNPEDDPSQPNVLLIGDSVSIGYTVQVRKSLAGKADVYRIPENGKYTEYGLERLDDWIGTRTWDVIHFNWGLWDICYRNPDSTNQGNRDKVNGTLTTTPEEYEVNMEQIVARLKETDAALIWCTTTPVPANELGRFEGDEIIYNGIAGAVMATNGVSTDDLHSYALLALPAIQLADGDVHFTDEGYVYLGEKVAQEIEALLPEAAIEDLGIGSQPGGADMVLSWLAQSGASYGVTATTNLADGPWIEMTNGISGNDELISVTNSITGAQQFFHVYLEE
jgi:hypothetical protein